MSGPGALQRWRQEIRAGTRNNRNVSDVLHQAACWEQSGDDAVAMGWDDAAADDYREARRIMADAGLPLVEATPAKATAANLSPLDRALAQSARAAQRIAAKRRAR